MADLITSSGYPIPADVTPGPVSYSGQMILLGGGGTRRPITQRMSDNEVLEDIQHRGIVPYALARTDGLTMEHCDTNNSLGDANQPVTGGTIAPPQLFPVDQYMTRYDTGNGHDSGPQPVAAPSFSIGGIINTDPWSWLGV